MGGIAIGDINEDGEKEIIVPTVTHGIYAFSSDGSPLEGWPFLPEGAVWSSPSIGNLDGNGYKIVFGTKAGYIYILNPDGSLEKRIDVGHQIVTSPVLQDIDEDGSLEIFVGSTDGYVFAYSADGNVLSGDWPQNLAGPIESEICFSDFNNDGKPEAVVATSQGIVHLLNSEGHEIGPFPLTTFYPSKSSPSVFDLDRDGNLEILVGNTDGVYVLDVKSARGEGEYWSVYGASPWRTHNVDDISTGIKESSETKILKWRVDRPRPNPGNSRVRFSYFVPKKTQVKVDIFDVSGRAVRALFNGLQGKGRHFLEWNLRDSENRTVGNGVYFFRLKARDYIHVEKVLILR